MSEQSPEQPLTAEDDDFDPNTEDAIRRQAEYDELNG